MKGRYLQLAVLVVVLAIAVSVLARRAPRSPRSAPAPAPPAAVSLALTVEDGHIVPEASEAPKDHPVELRIVNRGRSPVDVSLAGYEDRVALHALSAGEERRLRFVADRPGADFAWLLDGNPAGRFTVTGSHLIEGHR